MKKKTIICYVSLFLVLVTAVAVYAAPHWGEQLPDGWDQEPPPAGTVTIGLHPASLAVIPGRVFAMDVVIDATSQEVDSAQVYIDFDPSYLTVVDEAGEPASEIMAGRALPDTIFNAVDNQVGQIGYAACYVAQGASLQLPFVLATIRFRAEELTPRTDVTFHLDAPRATKVNIGPSSVPIHALTDGEVRIYVYRLLMPLIANGQNSPYEEHRHEAF